jgi:putative sigma-54 modulation protein
MDVQLTFRHLDPSDALADRARERAGKLEKFLHKAARAHVVFTKEASNGVHISLSGSVHFEAEAHDDDFYIALDQAFDKAETQLRKEHEKHKRGA